MDGLQNTIIDTAWASVCALSAALTCLHSPWSIEAVVLASLSGVYVAMVAGQWCSMKTLRHLWLVLIGRRVLWPKRKGRE